MNKKALSISLVLAILIILSSVLLLTKKPNSKTIPNNKKASGMMNYSSDISNDPDSDTWKEWGTKVSEDEVDDKLSFKITFPPEDKEDVTGKLTAIMVEGDALQGSKANAVNLFFSSGIRVLQILWVHKTPPITQLEDYGVGSEQYNEEKKIWSNVDINGLDGMAYGPMDQQTLDGPYRAPGAVSWYEPQSNIDYTLYGNGEIELEKLLAVARLFKTNEK